MNPRFINRTHLILGVKTAKRYVNMEKVEIRIEKLNI